MKLTSILQSILTFAVLSAPFGSAQAGITLNPLWAIDPTAGSPVAGLGNTERGISYNPVSGNVLVCTRATADIFVLNRNTGAILQEPEIGPDGLPTGNQINRKLLKKAYFLPPALPGPDVVTSSGTSGALNLVGIAADGVVYACNLVVTSQTANFRIYRWEKDGISTVEENYSPYIAWPPLVITDPPADPPMRSNGNPDVSLVTSQRWGDSFTVRGSGLNTQIIVGSDAGAIALFTTTNGVDFTPAFLPGALTGAGRGLGFGAGNTFYSKSAGGTTLRRSSFTVSPPAVAVLNNFALPAPASNATNPLAVDLATNRLAMIDLTTGGLDVDLIRLYDISAVGASPLVLASRDLAFTNGNTNQTGAIAMGDNKIFACSTNKGIQAFTIVDDNQPALPTVAVTPTAPAVWTRGVLTLTGAVTGTPPLTYAWFKDSVLRSETTPTLTISPVLAATAGAYQLKVTNSAGTTESNVVNVTTPASLDTGVLTKQWQLAPGSRPWLTAGDTERGLDVNPILGRVYVVSRAAPLSVQVLDSANGNGVGALDLTGVTGGLAGIALNMIGVAGDGAIYACNLADDTNPLKIYRWADDSPATQPEVAFSGNPIAGRLGDGIDVRGSGAGTEIVIGSRNTDSYVIFKFVDGLLTQFPILGTTAANGSFGLAVAFGSGNEVWAKSTTLPLVRTSFNTATGTGTLLSTFPVGEILGTNAGLAIDPVNNLVAISGIELSDSVRLYRVLDASTGTLDPLDQEFYSTDNINGNGTGAATLAGGKLYTLNTNNGIIAFNVSLAVSLAVAPTLTNLVRNGNTFSFTLNGTNGSSYLIQRSPDLATWVDDGIVTITSGTSVAVSRTGSETRLFFRAKAQ